MSAVKKIGKLVNEEVSLFSRMLFTEWQFWSKKNKYSISGIYIIKKASSLNAKLCLWSKPTFVGRQHCLKALLVDSSLLNFVDKAETPSSCNQISREQKLNMTVDFSRDFGHQVHDEWPSFFCSKSQISGVLWPKYLIAYRQICNKVRLNGYFCFSSGRNLWVLLSGNNVNYKWFPAVFGSSMAPPLYNPWVYDKQRTLHHLVLLYSLRTPVACLNATRRQTPRRWNFLILLSHRSGTENISTHFI